ncbi:E3 ubiquitin-protein ligase RNF103-like [Oculina patagonica]
MFQVNARSQSSVAGMLERCRPDSGHDVCCVCLQGAFPGCLVLPCSHKVHAECLIAMIIGGELNCPTCNHPFLRRG